MSRAYEGIYCVGCYEEAKYAAGEGATSCLCNHTWVLPDGLVEFSGFRHMGLSPMTRERYIEWASARLPSRATRKKRVDEMTDDEVRAQLLRNGYTEQELIGAHDRLLARLRIARQLGGEGEPSS